MGQGRNDRRVATVGSPSSNYEVTLDIGKNSRAIPLVGSVVSLENAMGEGSELALGTVTEVVTTNKWHEDPTFRGLLRDTGEIAGMSGDDGDIRRAVIRIQAAWKRAAENEAWTASGPNLRMSPATGTPVCQISGGLVEELISGVEKVSYMGHLAGTEGIPLPLSMPDFSSSLGAFSTGVYGLTGSGKSLDIFTPIPTPTGWKNMGDLVDGDMVLDEKGHPCRVVIAHEIRTDRDCYEITFSDESKIIADGDHLWQTETRASRSRGTLERSGKRKRHPLLPDNTRAKLYAIADMSSSIDVITMGEIEKLTGLHHSSSILRAAARRVGPAGSVKLLKELTFSGAPSTRTRTYPAWPSNDILEALLQESKKSKRRILSGDASSKIMSAKNTAKKDAWVTTADIARILGLPTRNSGLRKLLQSLPVKAKAVPITTAFSRSSGTSIQAGSSVTTYPKALILREIANHCTNLRGYQRHKQIQPDISVLTTIEIMRTLRAPDGSLNHAVRVARPLQLPDISLPVPPYSLGAFLGDGDSRSSAICGIDKEIIFNMETEGFAVVRESIDKRKANTDFRTWRLDGLRKMLLSANLIQRTTAEGSQKHIPEIYLRASISQRKALLAGLLDTDGTVSPQGTVQFSNTNERLASQVRELALSLGYRATVNSSVKRSQNGTECVVYTVAWTCEESPFRLSRKTAIHAERNKNYSKPRNLYRYITSVEPVESRPVRCITVDSPNHLYLAGESMIPTHNTQCVAMMLASQMRHEQHGIIIVDPQGQWASEEGMVFSVQGFAAELGREVIVRRISSDLRLAKDAPLMTNLLKHTRLVVELGLKHENTEDIVWYEITKALRNRDDWTKDNSGDLLKSILEYLAEDGPANRVYTTPDNAKRFQQRVQDVLDDAGLFKEALHQFSPVHNLFQAKNPSGNERHDLKRTLMSVFDRVGGGPAPLLILDMSSMALPGMDEEVDEGAERAYEILEKDTVKAAVLRNLFHTLKIASEDKFRSGTNLNTLVVLDEAWRYAAPTIKVDEEELQQLSKDLAGYARDTRKFGIGWLYISQSTRSVNLDIWDQMTVRLFGYGLNGADLEKMAEVIDDRSVLRLYRSSGNPRSTGVYPFMMAGPVSPLAANATPVMLQVYTSFQAFRDDNYPWIRPIRERMGLNVASGDPSSPRGMRAGALKPRSAAVGSGNLRKDIIDSSKAVRDNRAAGGMKDPTGFGDSLSDIDDDVPF